MRHRFQGEQSQRLLIDTLTENNVIDSGRHMLEKLTAQNLFALAFRIHHVKTEAVRRRKIETFVEMLERGETIYPQRNK